MRSLIKSILIPAVTLAMSAFVLQACDGASVGGSCIPNSTQACICSDTESGVQTCLANGTFSECACNGGGNGGNGGNGGSNGSGTAGAGGGTNCHALPNTPATCGDGIVQFGEECDDGNCVAEDACNNNCKNPFCGDKVVQAGEACDDGNNEVNDVCLPDCSGPNAGSSSSSSSSSSGAPPDPQCTQSIMFAGYVAPQKGAFAFNGQIGLDAANAACQAIGAFGMCNYLQIKEIQQNPGMHAADVAKLVASGTKTAWIHRTTPETVGGVTSVPAAGCRCNDWNYNTGHISDGERFTSTVAGASTTISFQLDNDCTFDPMNPAPYNAPGMECNVELAIPCCFECIPEN